MIKEPSMFEKTEMYEITSASETDNKVCTHIRTYNGAEVICSIPVHSRQENAEIAAHAVRAICQAEYSLKNKCSYDEAVSVLENISCIVRQSSEYQR
jgi:hypothetical protein